ncbi:vacuolar sorting protein 39 domain 2-domain-containing protein [Mycena metata]|uniref:Vacuolar sorting protein 39 domain 2-domain-containing protein n=1 Tax=Mycena metata TaxID=1033252 RepID=A0AAD7HCZ0_9AGAR|nr:vacuolar sorting protein 39 domain 2-domain-containing protein [Mycena metata]
MAPFELPKAIVSGFKDKIECLAVQGDRLYVGTATGNLHIYSIDGNGEVGDEAATLVETKKGLARKAIEQIGFIRDINSLVVLSGRSPWLSAVTLFPLPTFSPATPLLKVKAAFSFAIHSAIQHISPDTPTGEFSKPAPIPTLITKLVVGCRRKVVVYSWKDGEPQETKEAPLPHSARVISFLDKDTACFAYSPTEYAIFSIPAMTATEISIPLPVTAAGSGMAAFSGLGLGGYMSLGLGAKPKPGAIQISDSEVLILKDNEGIFIGRDAAPSRPGSIEWPAPPEEIAFVKPYIFSVLPPGSIPPPSTKPGAESSGTAPQPTITPTTVVQIRSSTSLLPTQTLSFPFKDPSSSSSTTPPTNASVRLMTASSGAKSPLFLVTTPTDRTVAAAEGSTIWQFKMKSWDAQIDELVAAGQYADALTLLDTIDVIALADKEQRATRIRGLNAVSQFRASQFDTAIDTLIALDVNPAKVVALYPEAVAGRLSVPQDAWIPLFGGPAHIPDEESTPSTPSPTDSPKSGDDNSHHKQVSPEALESLITSASGTIRGRFKTGLGAFLPAALKEDDRASITPPRKPKQTVHGKCRIFDYDLPRSVETLLRYLSDRRPKVGKALAAVGITPANQSHEIAFLSETSVEDLFALPNAPLSALTPEQLLRFAQIVDTALFKSYLLIRPGLLGSLCRVSNWCEVSEVEEELLARKVCGLLVSSGVVNHILSEQETDMEDKLTPSIYYLQKLGPEHLDEIFASSRWLFEKDSSMAFQIFTSEDVELPRASVANYLESIDPLLCIRYLEFLIEERREESTVSHDRLAELYLKMTLAAKKRNDKGGSILLKFIDTTDRYRIDRLYNMISSEDLFEARAILLGRFGRHDQALELYVYRLQDYLKAEQHCARVYRAGTETSNVYLTLLRIYLRPTAKSTSDLLQPALELIARHSPQLDAVDTLQLLPPLVTTQDIRTFLIGALRAPIFDTRVVRNLTKARGDQVERKLMALQTQRVKVTDSRICPQCHKRIGNSFIAVHAPRGEVTHYQCREAFSRRLNETRR